MDSDDALRSLLDGNRRYIANETIHHDRHRGRLAELSQRQEPFATIVGCADSRVPAELVFDGGLGDLFVVRTAGHVIDNAVLATIEFGVQAMEIPLIFVLGHERCEAVRAAIRARDGSVADEGVGGFLIRSITPAVELAKDRPGDVLVNAVRANVELTIDRLRSSAVIGAALDKGRIKIAGGLYDLDSGLVDMTVPGTS